MPYIKNYFNQATIYFKDKQCKIKHRTDGPAIEWDYGHKEWWVNGKRHRKNGPAVEGVNGHKEWWVNGLRHRLDGPACEYSNGDKSFFISGRKYSEAEYRIWGFV